MFITASGASGLLGDLANGRIAEEPAASCAAIAPISARVERH
jgi:hypothetical protein